MNDARDMTCPKCGSVLSAVTWTCVRGDHCCGQKGKGASTADLLVGWRAWRAAQAADEIGRLRADCDEWRRLTREAAAEIEWLRGERNRLAADLAKAHKDAVAWMEKVHQPAAEIARLREALRQIAHSAGYDTIISPDGDRHQRAIEIALEALTEGGR